MRGQKSIFSSLTFYGALVSALAGLAQLVGYSISPDDQAALANLIQNGVTAITALVSIAGSAVAIWGRVRATQKISPPA